VSGTCRFGVPVCMNSLTYLFHLQVNELDMTQTDLARDYVSGCKVSSAAVFREVVSVIVAIKFSVQH